MYSRQRQKYLGSRLADGIKKESNEEISFYLRENTI
jgi:hypothetical protein